MITPDRAGGPYVVTLLGTLLPQAFGPQNLGNLEGLAEGGAVDQEPEMLIPSGDPLVFAGPGRGQVILRSLHRQPGRLRPGAGARSDYRRQLRGKRSL